MSADKGRSAPKRTLDKAALGVLVAITAGVAAGGWAAKKILDVIGPGKALREQRGRERSERDADEGAGQ